ncbi:polysaccharide biosynthesis/export family protein [Myxococcota bacterium]
MSSWKSGPIAVILGLTACSHNAVEVPRANGPGEPMPMTALGPGDVFNIRVYGEADLSGEYRVASDGSINFPLIGKVDVDGKTANQISDIISDRLKKFVKDPSVSVFVKEYQSKKVYVYGKVQRAGTFPYEDGMNIIQAITLAGGFSKMANQDVAYVTRIVEGQEQRIKVSVKDIGEGKTPNFQLEPGDIVYVDESWY